MKTTKAKSIANLEPLIVLLASGQSRQAVIDAATSKLGMTTQDAEAAVAEAKRRITLAATFDPDEELGKAITRLHGLYKQAVAVQDTKAALAVQREIARLMMLTAPGRKDGADATLTGTQLANLFDVNRATVTSWAARGCPRDSKKRYSLRAVLRWWKEDVEARNGARAAGREAAQDRKAAAQAERAELEVKRLRGELTPTADVVEALAARAGAFRRETISLCRRLPMLLDGQPRPEMARICEAQGREMLNRFAAGAVPLIVGEQAGEEAIEQP